MMSKINSNKNNFVHSDFMRSNQLNGAGLLGSMPTMVMDGKHLSNHARTRVDTETGKLVRNAVKQALHERMSEGGAMSGGAGASKSRLKHNLL